MSDTALASAQVSSRDDVMAREHAPDDLLNDSWLIELQRLVPALHDRYPDLPLPVDNEVADLVLLLASDRAGTVTGADVVRRGQTWSSVGADHDAVKPGWSRAAR
jgi:hypothetical protein